MFEENGNSWSTAIIMFILIKSAQCTVYNQRLKIYGNFALPQIWKYPDDDHEKLCEVFWVNVKQLKKVKKKTTKKQDICKPMLTSNTPCSYMNIQNKKSQH